MKLNALSEEGLYEKLSSTCVELEEELHAMEIVDRADALVFAFSLGLLLGASKVLEGEYYRLSDVEALFLRYRNMVLKAEEEEEG